MIEHKADIVSTGWQSVNEQLTMAGYRLSGQ